MADKREPLDVVAPQTAEHRFHVLGRDRATLDALGGAEARVDDPGVAIVGEACLDGAAGADVRRRLAAGEVVIVLAQNESAGVHYPLPVVLQAVDAELRFTTVHRALPSLPRRTDLVAEDSAMQAHTIVARIGPGRLPDTPVVVAYRPKPERAPDATAGTVVGSHQVGPGRLVFCQYRLCAGAANGDVEAGAVLAELLRWASVPRLTLAVEESRLAGGRRVARYSHSRTVAR